MASPDGRDGSVKVHQDADIYTALLGSGDAVNHEIRAGRGLWLQVVRGVVNLDDARLVEGDGAALEDETSLRISGEEDAEILVFDLA